MTHDQEKHYKSSIIGNVPTSIGKWYYKIILWHCLVGISTKSQANTMPLFKLHSHQALCLGKLSFGNRMPYRQKFVNKDMSGIYTWNLVSFLQIPSCCPNFIHIMIFRKDNEQKLSTNEIEVCQWFFPPLNLFQRFIHIGLCYVWKLSFENERFNERYHKS